MSIINFNPIFKKSTGFILYDLVFSIPIALIISIIVTSSYFNLINNLGKHRTQLELLQFGTSTIEYIKIFKKRPNLSLLTGYDINKYIYKVDLDPDKLIPNFINIKLQIYLRVDNSLVFELDSAYLI